MPRAPSQTAGGWGMKKAASSEPLHCGNKYREPGVKRPGFLLHVRCAMCDVRCALHMSCCIAHCVARQAYMLWCVVCCLGCCCCSLALQPACCLLPVASPKWSTAEVLLSGVLSKASSILHNSGQTAVTIPGTACLRSPLGS
jgi:hypothetical protein